MKQLRSPLAALSIILVTSLFGYFYSKQHSFETSSEIFLTIAGTALGIVVTVWLIDRTLSNHAQLEQSRRRKLALERLSVPLRRHLSFLQFIYKASCDGDPKNYPASIKELFTPSYFETAKSLDTDKPAPVANQPEWDWAMYINYEINHLESSVGRVLDRYLTALDSNDAYLLECLISSNLVGVSRMIPSMRELNKKTGKTFQNIFTDDMSSALHDHVQNFTNVVDLVNCATVVSGHIGLSANNWSPIIEPKFGSARISAL